MNHRVLIFVFILGIVTSTFAQTVSIEIFPASWDMDSIYYGEIISMDTLDTIRIINTDTLPVDLSMWISSITPTDWTPSMHEEFNRFSLRAEFTFAPSPPLSFSPYWDYLLLDYPISAAGSRFGPGGYNIPPDDTQYLYFQFIRPSWTTFFYMERTFCVDICATYHLSLKDISTTDTTISVCISGDFFYEPENPTASEIEIEYTDCTVDREFVQFKSLMPLMFRPIEEVQFYMLYRTQWAPFSWDDLNAISAYSDSMWIIDPIEDWIVEDDPIPYRWYTYSKTRDYFDLHGRDTVYDNAAIWGADHIGTGVCNPKVNWYYVCVAVDTTPLPYQFSDEPSKPVGEYDQWIVNGATGTMNIVSYAVRDWEVSDYSDSASAFGAIIPDCICVAEWDAVSQDTVTLANKIDTTWTNYGYVELGNPYIVYLSPDAPDSALFSLCSPGNVPFDDDEPWDSLAEPSGGTGFNLIAVPYQRYNILLSAHGSFPVPARIIGEDISDARPDLDVTYIARWNPETQSGDAIAINSSGTWTGDNPVYPGEPLMIYIADSLDIKEHYSNRYPEAFLSILPNPFNSSVSITAPAGAEIEIYDLRGTRIADCRRGLPTSINDDSSENRHQEMSPTSRTFIWTPDKSIASGIYLVRASMEGQTIVKRIVYVR